VLASFASNHNFSNALADDEDDEWPELDEDELLE
jgi:hypothetical protein